MDYGFDIDVLDLTGDVEAGINLAKSVYVWRILRMVWLKAFSSTSSISGPSGLLSVCAGITGGKLWGFGSGGTSY